MGNYFTTEAKPPKERFHVKEIFLGKTVRENETVKKFIDEFYLPFDIMVNDKIMCDDIQLVSENSTYEEVVDVIGKNIDANGLGKINKVKINQEYSIWNENLVRNPIASFVKNPLIEQFMADIVGLCLSQESTIGIECLIGFHHASPKSNSTGHHVTIISVKPLGEGKFNLSVYCDNFFSD